MKKSPENRRDFLKRAFASLAVIAAANRTAKIDHQPKTNDEKFKADINRRVLAIKRDFDTQPEKLRRKYIDLLDNFLTDPDYQDKCVNGFIRNFKSVLLEVSDAG